MDALGEELELEEQAALDEKMLEIPAVRPADLPEVIIKIILYLLLSENVMKLKCSSF